MADRMFTIAEVSAALEAVIRAERKRAWRELARIHATVTQAERANDRYGSEDPNA